MFHRLHRQLTFFCACITSMIFLFLGIACLAAAESGIRSQEEAAFQKDLNTLYQSLSFQNTISHQWIRQASHTYQSVIRLLDNGHPLFFGALNEEEDTTRLLDQAQETAASQYGLNLESSSSSRMVTRHEEFTIKGEDGVSYSASAALIPRQKGNLGVLVLHSLKPLALRLRNLRLTFAGAGAAAVLLLGIFSWHFTKKVLAPVEESRKRQTQFVASASHELRSPLTVILTTLSAVRSGILPRDDSFLDTLESEGSRMSRLITDMLQLANADSHNWSMFPVPTELDTLLLQTWESNESLAFQKNLGWEIRLPEEEIPPCCCDPERIRQVLSILIDNAFSYTPAGGRILLELKAQGTYLCLTVADNGPGIPDSEKAAVFQRFYRMDQSRKSKSHFGLGLSIASEIISLHKGQLLLTDTPGGGATFQILLPCS